MFAAPAQFSSSCAEFSAFREVECFLLVKVGENVRKYVVAVVCARSRERGREEEHE